MTSRSYSVGNMDCAGCAREVEEGVARLEGVQAVRVDFGTGRMTLEGDVPFELLQQRVQALGKTLSEEAALLAPAGPGGLRGFWLYLRSRTETRLALIGGGIILLALAAALLGLPEEAAAVAYTAAMMIALYPIARSGLNALRFNRSFNINLLMTIAALGAVVIGEHLEAATVIFLFAIGEALEGYTADRARDSLRQLVQLMPDEALRLHEGREQPVPVAELRVGDHILVRPGQRLPMDGLVLAGSSMVDQSPITGESIPVYRSTGDAVYAGSINGDGALELRVTHLAADNTLSRIVRLVAEAQSERAPSQRMIDRFAAYYTPGVVVAAVLVALLPPLLFGAPFYDTPDGYGWLYRALAMLVIACPCALVISTPVTVISAITAAARRGVLIKGGVHLEALAGVQVVALDKTGTLTQGRPQVTQARAVDCAEGVDWCEKCADVLAMAAAVERRSAHPLARAVVAAAEERALAGRYAAAEDVQTLAGRGVAGYINGRLVTLGSHELFEAEHPHPPALCALIDTAEAQGQTTMLLCDGDGVRGFIALADTPRPEAQTAIAELNKLGLQTVMLTGDNEQAARAVGRAVGVRDVRAGLLPQDKVAAVRGLLGEHGPVAMVGDGINDTPALAAATVGVAMGGAGSAQALETADIALMADDIQQLPAAVRLARLARHLIRQNIALSLGLKALFLVLALLGGASLWAAVLADVGMSLAVTLNGMRPLRMS